MWRRKPQNKGVMYCCLCQGTCAARNKQSCSVQTVEERLIISSEYLFSLLLEDPFPLACTWWYSKDAIRHILLHFLGHGILHSLMLGCKDCVWLLSPEGQRNLLCICSWQLYWNLYYIDYSTTLDLLCEKQHKLSFAEVYTTCKTLSRSYPWRIRLPNSNRLSLAREKHLGRGKKSL